MRALLISSLCLLAACGRAQPQPSYPPSFETNFQRACESQGTGAVVCACTWQKVRANISSEDFAAFERLPASEREKNALQAQITRYAHDCQTYPATP